MDEDDFVNAPRPKRFKHQSYKQQLKDVHLPSAFDKLKFQDEVGDNDSHFYQALEHWRQLNLAPSFIQFANKASPLTGSMPLLLHHWQDVLALWTEAMEGSDDEGFKALLDLLQKFTHDLRTTIAPAYDDILQRLLKLLVKAIEPAALTALLETFNCLFRYLLVPSIHLDLLEQTWTAIKSTLPKCLPGIQRAMAEVWGSVLRKLKTTAREKAVRMLAAEADVVDDASAWVLVYASQSVSQSLHTATPSIFTALLAYHLEADNPEPTYNLIRRSLTALMHHVKSAEQFAQLGELVVKSVVSAQNPEHVKRSLNIATVVCSVREGSRLTDAQKATLAAQLEKLSIQEQLQPALLPFVTSLFVATDMAQWVGPGLKFLQRCWAPAGSDDDEFCLHFALKLHGALAESAWGGWKMIALPLVLKGTARPNLLEKTPRRTLAFAAALKRKGKLSTSEVDVVWRTKVEQCALRRLDELKEQSGEDVDAEINDILTLSSFFSPAVTPAFIEFADRSLNARDGGHQHGWIIQAAIHHLSKRPSSEWTSQVKLSEWAKLAAMHWPTSHHVLDALVVLSEAASSSQTPLSFDVAYPSLQPALLSHSRSLRLAALRFLNSKLVSVPEGTKEVVERCLQGEYPELSMKGVRDRVLRIGRAGQVVGDAQAAEVCTRWLISQLKVNLRPIWSPATTALASLSSRFGDVVWRVMFNELKQAALGEMESISSGGEPEQDATEPFSGETERTWRAPSAAKLLAIVAGWDDEYQSCKEYVKSHEERERFDAGGYEFQLLVTFGECSQLVGKHNRELVPFFLGLLTATSEPPAPVQPADINLADIRLSKQKLLAWFTLFSKFSNPKALYCTDTLKALYTMHLSHPSRPLQTVASACILAYNSPNLSKHANKLKALLDDTQWRDELTTLDLGILAGRERDEVVDFLTRLLFGIMLEKRGRSRGADRRAAVLTALGSCTDEELGLLVDLMLQPLGLDRSSHSEAKLVAEGGEGNLDVKDFSTSDCEGQMVGFLTLLGDVMRLLGSRLVAYWPALIGATIDLTSFAHKRIEASKESSDEEEDAEEEEDVVEEQVGSDDVHGKTASPKALRSIRQLGLKRLADFFRVPISYPFAPFLPAAFAAFISPRLEALAQENAQAPSALLDLFQVWARNESQVFFLVEYDNRLLPALYKCLLAVNVKPAVVDRVFDIVEKILGHAEEDARVKAEVLEPHVDLLLTNVAKLVEYAKHSAPPKRSPGASQSVPASLSLSLTTPLGQRHLALLSLLAPYSTSPSQAVTLLNLFLPIFRKPNKQAPEKVKGNILIIVRNMMRLVPELRDVKSGLGRKLFDTLSHLVLMLRTRGARALLVEAFQELGALVGEGQGEGWLRVVAEHLAALNSYSAKRLDEPDFDRRLGAYSSFNDESDASPSASLYPLAWVPVIQQAFFDIQDGEELAVRASASQTLKRFVILTAAEYNSNISGPPTTTADTHTSIFLANYLPGLRALISTPLHFHSPLLQSALSVKADLLAVLAYSIANAPDGISPLVAALRPLLEGGDEEANFFNNVLHIQLHRRTRAVRRLGERCDRGGFNIPKDQETVVVRDWLVPIVSWFVGNGGGFSKKAGASKEKGSGASRAAAQRGDQEGHLTTNEAVLTIGKLAKLLPWSPYYALVQRYLRLAKAKTDFERVYVRTIVSVLENFTFEVTDGDEATPDVAKDDAMDVDSPELQTVSADAVEGDGDAEVDADLEEEGAPEEDDEPEIAPLETKPIPRRQPKILTSLKDRLLPALLSYLSPPSHRFNEDETPLTTRLPVAIAIARLTLYLPITSATDIARKKTELRRLATELSHMMRSRSQEVRDSVREVLGKIARLVLGVGEEERKAIQDSMDDGAGELSVDRVEYLKVIVEELATALTRGPQVHVLACTVQSIVTKVTIGAEDANKPENEDEDTPDTSLVAKPAQTLILLDNIIPLMSEIASSILFGDVATTEILETTNQLVPVNHASAAFREPKKSTNASYTLFALGAQFSSPSMLPTLLKDVRSVMSTTSNLKVLTVVDEVLRRVGGGLERNPGVEKAVTKVTTPTDSDWLLNVVWGMISGNVAFLKERAEPLKTKGRKGKKRKDGTNEAEDHIVQTKRVVKQETDHYAHNSFRFIVLGLDLLNTSLRRGRLSDSSSVAYRQLDALLPVIGNTLYSASTPVLLAALKSTSMLVTRFHGKLPGMRRALPVYVNQVIGIIKASGGGGGSMGGTDGDLLQTALRTLGVMIRDGPKTTTGADGTLHFGVDIKEQDLSFLLELVTPDLEDPEKQNVAFTLMRAIVSRRFIVPEMYDIMEEKVAPLLVQSQSAVVREQARALLLQFMLDYPQGKGRLQKTLAFLLRNASSYVHESGRISILELLGAVLTKFQSGLIKEYGEMIFVTLVMVLANDDSAKCKEVAATLLATLYGRFDMEGRKTIVRSWLRKWVKAGVQSNEGGKKKLAWVALQVWGVVVDAAAKGQEENIPDWCKDTLEDITLALTESKSHLDALTESANEDAMDVDNSIDWHLPYYSLTALGKVLRVVPSYTRCNEDNSALVPWNLVTAHLLFPHAWVRTASCRTVGVLFTAHPPTSSEALINSAALQPGHPFAPGGLRDTAAKLCDQLKSEHLDSALGLQVVKNLVWIGRFWASHVVGAPTVDQVEEVDEEEEEEMGKSESLDNLPWLFSKLSYQVRGALIRKKGRQGRNNANWSQQPLAAVRWFAAMTTYLEPKRLEQFLNHILSPVYRIIEEDTIRDDQLEELKSTSIELRELVQQKVGGTTFSLVYNTIRQRILDVQRDRKTKRVMLGTQHPEQAARRKEKKMQLKKDSKKRKDHSFADARGGGKRRRKDD